MGKSRRKYYVFGVVLLAILVSIGVKSLFGNQLVQGESENTEIADDQEVHTLKEVVGIKDEHHNFFEGTIGEMNVSMKITRSGDGINIGIVTSDDKEMDFTGTIENSSEFHAANMDGESILGYMMEDDEGKIIITGKTVLANYSDPLNVGLKLHRAVEIGDDIEDYYSHQDFNNITSSEAEAFALEIKHKISNKEEFVKLIRYPVSVNTPNESIKINSEDEMLSFYDTMIEDYGFQETVANLHTKYMFANYMGVSMGLGEIWFDKSSGEVCRIYAINL